MDLPEDEKAQKKAWQEVRSSRRFLNAFRGLHIVLATTRHFTIYIISAAAVIILGFYFGISGFEWIALVFSIGFVIVSEAFNTAIEIDIDLTSPQFHPYARDTKDVAAAAVLLSAITAVIVGLIVFIPKLL